MSGGVDSSVAAALLQRQGFEVEGMFMKNWSPDSIQGLTDCPWEEDQADAAAVCEKLGIPFRSVNFEREYKEVVVDYFLREYEAGRTPNPDVMCNKEIKFKAFLDEAKKQGADFIATGHYVRRTEEDGRWYLQRGLDENKDQSYFLWTLTPEQISQSLFPVGELTKPEVRKLAEELGLPTAKKKDSQGICFIGHIDLKKFLAEHLPVRAGEVKLVYRFEGQPFKERLAAARLVGRHTGTVYHTIGERAGELMDNGTYRFLRNGRDVPPVYVLHKEAEKVYLTEDPQDPQLSTCGVRLESWWFDNGSDKSNLTAQSRYQQRGRVGVGEVVESNGSLIVKTAEPLWAVASGQSLVLYDGDKVVGGGIVTTIDI